MDAYINCMGDGYLWYMMKINACLVESIDDVVDSVYEFDHHVCMCMCILLTYTMYMIISLI